MPLPEMILRCEDGTEHRSSINLQTISRAEERHRRLVQPGGRPCHVRIELSEHPSGAPREELSFRAFLPVGLAPSSAAFDDLDIDGPITLTTT